MKTQDEREKERRKYQDSMKCQIREINEIENNLITMLKIR